MRSIRSLPDELVRKILEYKRDIEVEEARQFHIELSRQRDARIARPCTRSIEFISHSNTARFPHNSFARYAFDHMRCRRSLVCPARLPLVQPRVAAVVAY